MNRATLLSFIFIAASFPALPIGAEASPSPLWGRLTPGEHTVGFKAIHLFDDSRGYGGTPGDGRRYFGRPIRIFVWYPARPEPAGAAMRFGDYLDVPSGDRRFDAHGEMLARRDRETAARQFSHTDGEAAVETLLGVPTAAFRDARRAAGRFPLVLHSLGRNDFQQESTVLWEYLASHGYVVANVPQLGPDPERSRLDFSPDGMETQARDLEYALAALIRTENVDGARIATMGHSSGAVVAMLVAARNANVDAVISLDGSITTTDGRALLSAMGWPAAPVRVPLLDLYATGKGDLDQGLHDGLDSDIYIAGLGAGAPPHMATHFDFQNWPLYSLLTGIEDRRGSPFREGAYGAEVYYTACVISRIFLDATLRAQRPAREVLRGNRPTAEFSTDLATIVHRPGRGDAR